MEEREDLSPNLSIFESFPLVIFEFSNLPKFPD
jgi:hypothetical protein